METDRETAPTASNIAPATDLRHDHIRFVTVCVTQIRGMSRAGQLAARPGRCGRTAGQAAERAQPLSLGTLSCLSAADGTDGGAVRPEPTLVSVSEG